MVVRLLCWCQVEFLKPTYIQALTALAQHLGHNHTTLGI